MKKVSICLYILWAILAISSLFLWGNWWVATSFLWIPVSMAVSIMLMIAITMIISDANKVRIEKEEEPSCENCIFGISADLINKSRKEGEKEPCLGEKVYGAKKGTLCQRYMKK